MDIRIDEGATAQPLLLWDSVWDTSRHQADWQIAAPDETQNHGGLRATSALATAVVLALFTDRRAPDDHPLRRYADSDPRGWWGDGVDVRDDLGEEPLGSLLWLVERAPLTDEIVQWVEHIVREALHPLVRQKAVAKLDVTAVRAGLRTITYTPRLYGQDGLILFDRQFEIVWQQVNHGI